MITYADNPQAHHFEARDGESAVGFVDYRVLDETRVELVHTEVDDAHQGRGIAGELVRAALDHARAEGRRVVPSCPYVARWLTRHPGDYDDVVV